MEIKLKRVYEDIKNSNRIVVKVGTSTVTYPTGKTNLRILDRLARVLSDLQNGGREIVLVSSGAIGMAVGKLGLREKPVETVKKQAVAAVGQCELMYLYDKLFSEYNSTVAQILVTGEDIAVPRRKRNMRNTINELLDMGIIPIVNENDTVSADEIEIGDNDNLSALVANMIDADLLVLFSDIDGLYESDPHFDKNARKLDYVTDIDSAESMAGGSGTKQGTGGMITKLEAARTATGAGINMIIANGKNIDSLYDILEGKKVGTLFVSQNFKDPEEI